MTLLRRLAALLLVTSLALTACSNGGRESPVDASTSMSPSGPGVFPVRIETRLGTVEIPAAPKRVVALGMPDVDAALAVGIEPVGVVMNDSWPWQVRKLRGAEYEVLDTADGVPREAVAALEPDLILATGLGGLDDSYAALSKIAPVVGDIDGVLATDWDVTADAIGRALGRSEQMDAAIAAEKDRIRAFVAENPRIAGATFASGFAYDGSAVDISTAVDDPGVRFLRSLGFVPAPKVIDGSLERDAEGSKVGAGTAHLSLEELKLIGEPDALVLGYANDETRESIEGLKLFGSLSNVSNGHYVALDRHAYTASWFVTVGSIEYALDALKPLAKSFD